MSDSSWLHALFLPHSSVHGVSQARILEWFAISSSRGCSCPGIEPATRALAGGFFTTESPKISSNKVAVLCFFCQGIKGDDGNPHHCLVNTLEKAAWLLIKSLPLTVSNLVTDLLVYLIHFTPQLRNCW